MALNFVSRDDSPPDDKSGFDYKQWYKQNKKDLLTKRKRRYETDPVYREAALRRSKEQRDRKRQNFEDNAPFTIPFAKAAEQLGVTVWVLREWRAKNYFPEPVKRGGWLWLSQAQVTMLERLKVFFEQHGARVTESKRAALEDVVNLIYSNW